MVVPEENFLSPELPGFPGDLSLFCQAATSLHPLSPLAASTKQTRRAPTSFDGALHNTACCDIPESSIMSRQCNAVWPISFSTHRTAWHHMQPFRMLFVNATAVTAPESQEIERRRNASPRFTDIAFTVLQFSGSDNIDHAEHLILFGLHEPTNVLVLTVLWKPGPVSFTTTWLSPLFHSFAHQVGDVSFQFHVLHFPYRPGCQAHLT